MYTVMTKLTVSGIRIATFLHSITTNYCNVTCYYTFTSRIAAPNNREDTPCLPLSLVLLLHFRFCVPFMSLLLFLVKSLARGVDVRGEGVEVGALILGDVRWICLSELVVVSPQFFLLAFRGVVLSALESRGDAEMICREQWRVALAAREGLGT